ERRFRGALSNRPPMRDARRNLAAILAIGPIGATTAAVDEIVAIGVAIEEQRFAIGSGLVLTRLTRSGLLRLVLLCAGDAAANGAHSRANSCAALGVARTGIVADDRAGCPAQ